MIAMETSTLTPANEALGLDLGSRTIEYDETDAILYALAVGAHATDLELIFERDLHVLPTFALPHGLWAADLLGSRGFFSTADAVHGAQKVEWFAPIPPRGRVEQQARISAVWDKGSAAVFEVEVSCELWRASYAIFAPGAGGFGGERGPSARRAPTDRPAARLRVPTSPEQAALYRLTGDRHLIHIDPEAARAIGQPRPILHGLCTLGVAARELAGLLGHDPWELTALEARFSAAVLPGDLIDLRVWSAEPDGSIPFAALVGDSVVLDGGQVRFS
jgi:acyl dehydratase